MGNTTSTEQSDIGNLATQIDEIAVHYILNQNTIDLLRLTDKEYYDNLIILTSSVVEKKLNHLELGFLNQRIFGKSTISDVIDMTPSSSKIKEKIIFNISKFYIKIFMIYSAIATTIDPQYSYEDENGSKKLFYLKDMDAYKHIPKNVKPTLVQLTNPLNLCRKRLAILKNKLDYNVEGSFVKINPGEKLCSLSTTNLLTDEVGIKELDALYYDIFDYNTKSWSKRSKKMKIKYNKDLILFYQIFTGKKVKPAEIKSFHDIELLDMSTIEQCNDVRFMQDILVDKRDILVVEYLKKIDMIEDATTKYKSKLISILKELFVIKLTNDETTYTINPDLTLDHILLIETETRDTILNLYTSCEKYFIQALIIFEKIYDEQVKTLNVERLNYIDNIKTPPLNVIEQTPEPVFMPDEQVTQPVSMPLMTPEQKLTPEQQLTPEQVTPQVTMTEPVTQPVSMPLSTPEQVTPQVSIAEPVIQPLSTPEQVTPPVSIAEQELTPEPVTQPLSTPEQVTQPVSTPEEDTSFDKSFSPEQDITPQQVTQPVTPQEQVSPPVGQLQQVTPSEQVTPPVTPQEQATPPVSQPQQVTPPVTPQEQVSSPVSQPQQVTPPVTPPEQVSSPVKAETNSGSIFGNLFKSTPKPPTNTTTQANTVQSTPIVKPTNTVQSTPIVKPQTNTVPNRPANTVPSTPANTVPSTPIVKPQTNTSTPTVKQPNTSQTVNQIEKPKGIF